MKTACLSIGHGRGRATMGGFRDAWRCLASLPSSGLTYSGMRTARRALAVAIAFRKYLAPMATQMHIILLRVLSNGNSASKKPNFESQQLHSERHAGLHVYRIPELHFLSSDPCQ